MEDYNNINNYFDFSQLNSLDPKKGRVIISEPFLDDEYFSQSVVILCEHNKKGTFGFVLNNYVEQDIHEVLEEFPVFNGKISIGGPVEADLLFFLHNKPNLIEDSIEIIPNLYMGGNFSQVKKLILNGKLAENNIKFFLGYSGWGENQLEEEIEKNSWFVANMSAETIMSYQNDDIWKKTLEQMGKKHKIISNFPNNPNLN